MILDARLRRLGVALLIFLFLVPGTFWARDEAYFDKGLLFKIETTGRDPSFLFGTMHSEDPRVLRLLSQVRQAFDGSRQFAMEVLMDEARLRESIAALMLEEGRDLEDIVGPDLYRDTVKAVEALGYPAEACRRFKPWAVVTLLSIPAPSTGDYLDLVLYRQALEQEKQMIGLETVKEQLAPFDNLSDEQQILLLRTTLESQHELLSSYEELLAAYVKGDLAALIKLNDEHLDIGDPELEQRLNKAVIDDRNRRMARRLQPVLEKGGAFVALGALHLPGEQGVLNLLQRQGYHIERVF